MLSFNKRSNVSVIIPTFNRTNLLKRAVDSVLNQTHHIDEVIIVDDFSTKENQDQIKIYFKNDLKIKLIFNEKNMGASYSRNIGVKNARNDIVAFLDSDDTWRKDKIEKQINIISTKENIHLVYCAQSKKKLYRGNVLDKLLDFWLMPNTSTIMVTKEAFWKVRGFDEALDACQDHDFWISFSRAGFCVDYVDEDLVNFTNDAINRISFNYEPRIKAVKLFLIKWKKVIVLYKGEKYYKDFYKKYINRVLSQIILQKLKVRSYTKLLQIYLKHLAFNIYFYINIFKFLKKKLHPFFKK